LFNKERNPLLLLLLREKKLIIAGIITGFILFVFYYIFFYKALYTCKCKLYVKNITKSSIVADLSPGNTVVSESGYSNPLFNLRELLKSEQIAYRVYPLVKNKYPEDLTYLGVLTKEDFYVYYLKLITSSVEPSTDIMEIKLMWPNNKNAPEVLKFIISEFKKENLNLRGFVENKKRVFLDEQTVDVTKKLQDIRNKVKEFKLTSNITDIESETLQLVNARLELEKQVNYLKSQINYNTTKRNELAKELNISEPDVALRSAGIGTDPYLMKLSQDLAIAKQSHATMKAKFTEKFPEVIAVNNQIETLETLISERKKETVENIVIPRAIYDGPSSQVVTTLALTHAEIASLEEQLKTLQKGIAEIKKTEDGYTVKLVNYSELKNLEIAFNNAFQQVKQKQLEAMIKESEIIDNLIVLSYPLGASPQVLYILSRFLGFMILGSLLGLGLGYIKQALDDKWLDVTEMQAITGQNILGIVPWLDNTEEENVDKIMSAAYTNIASEIVSKAYTTDKFLITFLSTTTKSKNKSIVSESVVSRLLELGRSVVLIDLVPKNFEGTDLIDIIKSLNSKLRFKNTESPLFENHAKQNGSGAVDTAVLELTEQHLREYFGDAVKTLVDENGKNKILKLEINKQNININDYVTSKGFYLILESLKKYFEFVFINSPHGYLPLPEIQTLRKLSEGIIIISSIDTNRQNLLELIGEIESAGQNILGIIAREENSDLEKSFKLIDREEREVEEENE